MRTSIELMVLTSLLLITTGRAAQERPAAGPYTPARLLNCQTCPHFDAFLPSQPTQTADICPSALDSSLLLLSVDNTIKDSQDEAGQCHLTVPLIN